MRCDFCGEATTSVRRVALDRDYERLRTPHKELYACEACSAKKEQEEALAKLKSTEQGIKEEEESLARLKREQEMRSMMAQLTEIKEGQEKINDETVADAGRVHGSAALSVVMTVH